MNPLHTLIPDLHKQAGLDQVAEKVAEDRPQYNAVTAVNNPEAVRQSPWEGTSPALMNWLRQRSAARVMQPDAPIRATPDNPKSYSPGPLIPGNLRNPQLATTASEWFLNLARHRFGVPQKPFSTLEKQQPAPAPVQPVRAPAAATPIQPKAPSFPMPPHTSPYDTRRIMDPSNAGSRMSHKDFLNTLLTPHNKASSAALLGAAHMKVAIPWLTGIGSTPPPAQSNYQPPSAPAQPKPQQPVLVRGRAPAGAYIVPSAPPKPAAPVQPAAPAAQPVAYKVNAYGEEEFEGDRPAGDGWQQVGSGPGGKRWARPTQQTIQAQQQAAGAQQPQGRFDNGPYHSGNELLRERNAAFEYYHNAPYADSNAGEQQAIDERQAYVDTVNEETNRRLKQVNQYLDSSELRRLKITNPVAYQQRVGQIKQHFGFAPDTDTFREWHNPSYNSRPAMTNEQLAQPGYGSAVAQTPSGYGTNPRQQFAQNRPQPQQPRQYAQRQPNYYRGGRG